MTRQATLPTANALRNPAAALRRTLALLLAAASIAGATAPVLAQVATPMSSFPSMAPAQTSAPTAAPLANQSMLYPGEDFLLGPGDLIAVRVFLQADYQATVRITSEGTVELPFIGSVPLTGLTIRQAQDKIADNLRTGGYYRSPEVTIQVLESINGSIIVSGEVKYVVPATGPRRLIDVISVAGGLPATASHTVRILRPQPDGQEKTIVVNLGADLTSSAEASMLVYPRDIIQVSRAGLVYVLGAFKNQNAVPLDQATPLTLLQLASLSGGIGFEGRYNDLRLIRTEGANRVVVKVDIKKIRDGLEPDPVLQANDIVFLPTDEMKAALKNLGVGGLLGIVSLLYTIHQY
jgi:polysaccharide export outer membrane protein